MFIYSANVFLMEDASHAGSRHGGRRLIIGSAQLWKSEVVSQEDINVASIIN